MLAFAWRWNGAAQDQCNVDAARLAASLCAGIGGHAGSADVDDLHFAYRPLRSTAAFSRAWRPAILAGGRFAIFHGFFDNAEAIAGQLGVRGQDCASLYATAVEAWGDDADRRIVGEYCAIVIDPRQRLARLSRSPLRAPPLYHASDDDKVAAASVPRALFAAGFPQQLNEVRLSDSGMVNFSDQEASWFQGIYRVPLGSAVKLEHGRSRRLIRYYDALEIPQVAATSDEEVVERVDQLLDEAVRACLAGFHRPGATLSGGLDSSQVVARTVNFIPQSKTLPTFTFHPEEGFDGLVDEGMIGDERPVVEAFAAAYPRVEPHFTANEGYEHDHRWNDFFHLMGGAPSGLCNMYVFHGLFAGAARENCDLLLVSDWGNNAFSDKGYWGYVEYFLTGRWRQLWLALRHFPIQRRSLMGRFAAQCLLPLLPNRLWKFLRKLVFGNQGRMLDLMQPFSESYRAASGADERLRQSGLVFERYQPWNARHARQLLFQNDDGEAAEIYQAFEQMYGVAQRDPLAYRPLVEYCWGLPTRMFMRDGQLRWLAKEMAKGLMPEEQRANRLNGRWDADWHLRMGRRRSELIAELDRVAGDERFRSMFDVPRLRAALTDWPERTETSIRDYATREFSVPRALLAARFVNYVEGRNQR